MTQEILLGVCLFILGLVASVPSFVLCKKAELKPLMDRYIVAIQGAMGLLGAIYGVWSIMEICAAEQMALIEFWPLYWGTKLIVAAATVAMGAMMAYPMIERYALGKDVEAATKVKMVAGAVAIALGLWCVIYRLFIF